jgi:hypothetical protein
VVNQIAVVERCKSVGDELIEMQEAAGRFGHLALVHFEKLPVQPDVHPRVAMQPSDRAISLV